jgi:putative transcriptional regulator
MAKKRYEDMSVAELITAGLSEAVEIAEGHMKAPKRRRIVTARHAAIAPPPRYGPDDVKAVRARLGCSQAVLAQAFSVSAPTVRSWEQGARVPDGASRRLLQIAEKHPDVIFEVATKKMRRAVHG